MNNAFICDAIRTPIGRYGGTLASVRADDLGAVPLKALMARNPQVDWSAVEDIIYGCANQAGEDNRNVARMSGLLAGLPVDVPGTTVNRLCGSGMDAIGIAARAIKSGETGLMIAGGVESMSRVGLGMSGGAWFMDPSVNFPAYFMPQGVSADMIATKYGFSRDDVDAYSVESHKRAARAWAEGRFKGSVVPVKDQLGLNILDHDETVRPNSDMQSLGGLNPSFAMMGEMAFDAVIGQRYPEVEKIIHVHHAGNSSGIVDGAGAVLIGNEEFGKAYGLKPRARIRATAKIGTDPTIMLTGPVPVTEKILKDSGMSISDIDLFEVNEAFASVVLRFMQAFQVDPALVNVNGGSIALGHPLGATGAIIIGTLLDELERQDKNVGLATLCIASGMGAATIIERV